jgi:hypothetical protein
MYTRLIDLTQADKVFFSEAIMLWLNQYYQARPVRERLQHVLVLEEAQNLAPRNHESTSSRDLVDVLFSQCREYGLGLVLIGQMPSMISRSALANIHTFIASGVKEKMDASTLQSVMLLDLDQMNTLGQLPLGTSVVRIYRHGITEAFLMRTPKVPIVKGSISDDLIRQAMAPCVIAANVRDSFAFEGIRIEAPRDQSRRRPIVSSKKSAKG